MEESKTQEVAIRSKKRCGTCIDRKISCDRQYPTCSSCLRSNRVCQGYGLRLSWPRHNDAKRMLVGKAPVVSASSNGQRVSRSKQLHMINATFWDMDVYHYLTKQRRDLAEPLLLRGALPWSLTTLSSDDKDLFQYFESNVAELMCTVSGQPLGQSLLRVALSGNSRSCIAVQKSMLALTALHRFGLGFRAQELKVDAIRTLAAAAAEGVEVDSALQHVAAGMILCLFEIQQQTETSTQWLWYIRGARNVINSVLSDKSCDNGETSVILEWVYHHEVLACFSMRHWRRSDTRIPNNNLTKSLPPCSNNPNHMVPLGVPAFCDRHSTWHKKLFEPTRLLYEVISAIVPFQDPMAQTDEYKSHIMQLRDKLRDAAVYGVFDDTIPELYRCAIAKAETYRLSTLIYLDHATGDYLITQEELTALIDTGFRILGLMHTCERLFPLLVLGCEARTDDERILVLELIANSEKKAPVRRLDGLRHILQAFWTQDDLLAERGTEVHYMEKMTAVLSSMEVVPALA